MSQSAVTCKCSISECLKQRESKKTENPNRRHRTTRRLVDHKKPLTAWAGRMKGRLGERTQGPVSPGRHPYHLAGLDFW